MGNVELVGVLYKGEYICGKSFNCHCKYSDNNIAGWLVGSLDNAGWKKELHMKSV